MKTAWLKQRMAGQGVVLGTFCKMTEPGGYEILGLAGFDFAVIDMEHGPISFERAQDLIRACELSGISPVIRVPGNEEHYILRALDIGAHGVEVPKINTREQAEALARAARYHPRGGRGLCRYVRAAGYSSVPPAEFIPGASENVAVIAHLEGREGLDNLLEILAVDGIDVIFIGPYDLSQSLGIPGQVHAPLLVERMIAVVEQTRGRGKFVGTFVETVDDAKAWRSWGVTYLAYSVDVGLFYEKCTEIVRAVNGAAPR
ncbi:MAG: HpcH/HpaI aldolase family protein [Bacteroidota bacterium]